MPCHGNKEDWQEGRAGRSGRGEGKGRRGERWEAKGEGWVRASERGGVRARKRGVGKGG